MNYFRLFRTFFRLNFIGEAAYRLNFYFNLFQSALGLGISITGLAVIFSYTDSLGGWHINEMLALVGVFFLVGGMVRFAIQPGMEQLIESVRDGTFDFTLTKPEDAQLMISIARVEIWEVIDIALGIGVLIYALVRLGQGIGGWEAAEFIGMLFAGAVIVYSFFLILSTLSFWFVRVENFLTIFQSIYEAGRWPITIYPGWLRYGLTFVIPVAFATTVPVEALTGRITWVTLVIAFALAVALFVISRAFWKLGLRRYSSASS